MHVITFFSSLTLKYNALLYFRMGRLSLDHSVKNQMLALYDLFHPRGSFGYGKKIFDIQAHVSWLALNFLKRPSSTNFEVFFSSKISKHVN